MPQTAPEQSTGDTLHLTALIPPKLSGCLGLWGSGAHLGLAKPLHLLLFSTPHEGSIPRRVLSHSAGVLSKGLQSLWEVRPVSSKARPRLGMEETGRVERWDGNKQIRHLEASQSDGVRRHARRRMPATGASW